MKRRIEEKNDGYESFVFFDALLDSLDEKQPSRVSTTTASSSTSNNRIRNRFKSNNSLNCNRSGNNNMIKMMCLKSKNEKRRSSTITRSKVSSTKSTSEIQSLTSLFIPTVQMNNIPQIPSDFPLKEKSNDSDISNRVASDIKNSSSLARTGNTKCLEGSAINQNRSCQRSDLQPKQHDIDPSGSLQDKCNNLISSHLWRNLPLKFSCVSTSATESKTDRFHPEVVPIVVGRKQMFRNWSHKLHLRSISASHSSMNIIIQQRHLKPITIKTFASDTSSTATKTTKPGLDVSSNGHAHDYTTDKLRAPIFQHYTPSETVVLGTHRSSPSPSSIPTCLQFDPLGTFLAVADSSGCIQIYDFDEIIIADLSQRNTRLAPNIKTRTFKIPKRRKIIPCISFSTGNHHKIAHLSWWNSSASVSSAINGTNDPSMTKTTESSCSDFLVVTFSNCPEVRLYDLSSILTNNSTNADIENMLHNVVANTTAASRTPLYIQLLDSTVPGSNSSYGHSYISCFQRPHHATHPPAESISDKNLLHPRQGQRYVLAGDTIGNLRLWSLPSQNLALGKDNLPKAKFLWSIRPWTSQDPSCGAISDIVHIPPPPSMPSHQKGMVLITTCTGGFSIIDMDHLVRKSFATSSSPQVISTWSIHHRMQEFRDSGLPPNDKRWLGVKKCFLQKCIRTLSHTFMDFILVTNAGWILSMTVDMMSSEGKKSVVHMMSQPIYRVLHKSPKMELYSSTGEYYGIDASTSALPTFDSVACYLGPHTSLPGLMVTRSSSNRKFLASSDKRVLDACTSLSSSSSSSFSKKTDELIIWNYSTTDDTSMSPAFTISADVDHVVPSTHHSSIKCSNPSPKHVAIHPENEWMVAVTVGSHGNINQSHLELLHLQTLKCHSKSTSSISKKRSREATNIG